MFGLGCMRTIASLQYDIPRCIMLSVASIDLKSLGDFEGWSAATPIGMYIHIFSLIGLKAFANSCYYLDITEREVHVDCLSEQKSLQFDNFLVHLVEIGNMICCQVYATYVGAYEHYK